MVLETDTHHLDRVQSVVEGSSASAQDSISASWIRSATNLGIDPASNHAPQVLTTDELQDHRERAERTISSAQEELDQLYRVTSSAGYVALLSNEHGVIVDHRVGEVPSRFSEWGNIVGGVWSEEAEGTNGTGTCIAERRPITVHQSEHFRFRHIASSCSAAPIFGAGNELVGVLDISSVNPAMSEGAHKLAEALVTESARSIEERIFRDQFRRHWIVAVEFQMPALRSAMIAVDNDRRIVGLDRNARALVARTGVSFDMNTGFWTVFERDEGIFRSTGGDGDFVVRLTPIGGADTFAALITPPEPSRAIWRNLESDRLHCRPRRGLLKNVPAAPAPRRSAGGLPPRVLRSVEEYVEAHLGEHLDLTQLAATAGRSLHHFAHAFKISAGISPHQYILQRRISLASALLISSELPIADIAVTAGFSDQSHLTRHFRRALGVSPAVFRRSHR